jgi:hypothetical protein
MAALYAICLAAVHQAVAADDLPVIRIDRENFEIRESARIEVVRDVIADSSGDGAVHIIGDGLTVDFTGAHLRGAADGVDQDQYAGIGVRITGSNNRIRGGRFSGFKVAIFAHDADGLTIEEVFEDDTTESVVRP